MTDQNRNPLESIVQTLAHELDSPREIQGTVEIEPMPAPMPTRLPMRTFRHFDSRNPPRDPVPVDPPAYTGPKNGDVPRAGELTSQVFNDLTTRIIGELHETVESQITDAINRRAHVKAQIESLGAELDRAFGEYEDHAKRHQEKVKALAEGVRQKVKNDTEQMIALSNRLRDFADSVNGAHEKFLKE